MLKFVSNKNVDLRANLRSTFLLDTNFNKILMYYWVIEYCFAKTCKDTIQKKNRYFPLMHRWFEFTHLGYVLKDLDKTVSIVSTVLSNYRPIPKSWIVANHQDELGCKVNVLLSHGLCQNSHPLHTKRKTSYGCTINYSWLPSNLF